MTLPKSLGAKPSSLIEASNAFARAGEGGPKARREEGACVRLLRLLSPCSVHRMARGSVGHHAVVRSGAADLRFRAARRAGAAARQAADHRLPGATTPTTGACIVAAFLQRLRELGWVDGRNMAIEYRWAEGRERALRRIRRRIRPPQSRCHRHVGHRPGIAVKKATSVIPIVFATAGDPVGTGLVASLARPGGNVTGLSNQQTDLAGNRLELLREVVPGFGAWP